MPFLCFSEYTVDISTGTNKDLITENKSNFQLNIKYPWF